MTEILLSFFRKEPSRYASKASIFRASVWPRDEDHRFSLASRQKRD